MNMWKEIYINDYDFVFNYIKSKYNKQDDIEDLMNDTFIEFIKFYDSNKSSSRTFWILLMKNKIKTQHRRLFQQIFKDINRDIDIPETETDINHLLIREKLDFSITFINSNKDSNILYDYFINQLSEKETVIKHNIKIGRLKYIISKFKKEINIEWNKI